MKKFAKILLCILLITVSCAALFGCQTTEDKLKNSPLIGTWVSEPESNGGYNNYADYWVIEYDPEYSTDKLKRTVTRAQLTTAGTPSFGDAVLNRPTDTIDINNEAFKVSGDTLTVNGKVFTRTTLTLQEWKDAYAAEYNTNND